jgi:phosphoglycolate phosphatase-like HAD superfamily hydrolase
MMGCRINHLVFWADGVTVTPVWQAAWHVVCPERKPETRERLALHRLEQDLLSGALSPEEFCTRAIDLSGCSLRARDLMEKLPAQIAPIPGMPEVLEELACRRNALSLASGYPRGWLMPALERTGLTRWFAQDQVWVAPEEGGFPALLDALLRRGQIVSGRSLWVDDHSLRTTVALRRGIDAAVFVHARQFYRDLGLWGLVPLPGAGSARG